jgi:hypothetical protein
VHRLPAGDRTRNVGFYTALGWTIAGYPDAALLGATFRSHVRRRQTAQRIGTMTMLAVVAGPRAARYRPVALRCTATNVAMRLDTDHWKCRGWTRPRAPQSARPAEWLLARRVGTGESVSAPLSKAGRASPAHGLRSLRPGAGALPPHRMRPPADIASAVRLAAESGDGRAPGLPLPLGGRAGRRCRASVSDRPRRQEG